MKKFTLKYYFFSLVVLSFNSCVQSKEETNSVTDQIVIPNNLYPLEDLVIENHSDWTKSHYPKRIKEFKANPLEFGDIVLLGNSITEQGEDWASKIGNSKAKNRGIAGDTTHGILARLNEITFYKPQKLFLLIGINNLFHNPNSVDMIYEDIIRIVNEINSKSPNTEIFIQSILPTTTDNLITKIEELNKLLENASDAKAYTYINLHQRFVTLDKKMSSKYSTDGVHLNDSGYQIWSEIIKNLIE